MKILVVGGGGREHAIAWRLSRDPVRHEIYCAPGNAGTGSVAVNLPIAAGDVAGITAWARKENPDLVVVGPEDPLVNGLADSLLAVGVKTFGPVAACARIEGSKSFAKELMKAAGVPTARAGIFSDAAAAKAALPDYGLPVVIKADGLAAGKGVVVAQTAAEAEAAIDSMLVDGAFGKAGATVLVEEFLHGEECSMLAMTDGETAVLLPSSQDHKRAFDGDKGPNTGGMGAYSPAPVATPEIVEEVKERIVMPVVREFAKRGTPYRGILYAGLMVTPPGGKLALSGSRVNVVEFNARFGDPETEAVLPRIGGDFSAALAAAATGRLRESDVAVEPGAAATVILASSGYPGKYEKGKAVSGLEEAAGDGAVVFHCGTRKGASGGIETAGGRVFAATGCGATLREAVDKAYAAAGRISFDGMFFRRDIAAKAFAREAAE